MGAPLKSWIFKCVLIVFVTFLPSAELQCELETVKSRVFEFNTCAESLIKNYFSSEAESSRCSSDKDPIETNCGPKLDLGKSYENSCSAGYAAVQKNILDIYEKAFIAGFKYLCDIEKKGNKQDIINNYVGTPKCTRALFDVKTQCVGLGPFPSIEEYNDLECRKKRAYVLCAKTVISNLCFEKVSGPMSGMFDAMLMELPCEEPTKCGSCNLYANAIVVVIGLIKSRLFS